MYSNITVQR